MKVQVPAALGVVIELEAPDGADRDAITAFVHAVIDQVGVEIGRVTSQAIADLARAGAGVEALSGLGPRQRERQIIGIRDELQRICANLRPISKEFWGASYRLKLGELEAARRNADAAAAAKDATARPARLPGRRR